MQMVQRVVITIAESVLVAACGGGGSKAVPTDATRGIVGPARGTAALCLPSTWKGHPVMHCDRFPDPLPVNFPVAQLVKAALPQIAPPAFYAPPPPRGAPQSARRAVRSTVTGWDTGGQLGIRMYDEGTPVLMRVAHSYYDPSEVALNVPPADEVDNKGNRVTRDYLFAPTTKMSGGCYEAGVSYARDPNGTTTGTFYTFNFCLPTYNPDGTIKDVGIYDSSTPMQIGSAFQTKYDFTSTGADGVMREYYIIQILLMSDNQYHVALYNPNTGGYEDVKSTPKVTPTRTDAWSIFETHYVGTTPTTTVYCQPQQEFVSDELTLQATSADPYVQIDYSSHAYSNNLDCTKDDATYGAYYTQTTGPNYWHVDSSNSF
jgi:hypothetical protein